VKKQLLLSVALGAIATSSAIAAPPVPLYNWTGFYAGGNAGYSWGQGALTYNEAAFGGSGIPTSFSGSNKLNGAIGGVQFGYNWQISNIWVLGLETDFQLASEKASKGFNFPYNDGEGISTLSAQLTSQIQWFGTVRGRVGYLVTPTTLVYTTAGFAYGQVTAAGSFSDNGCGPPCTWSFNQTTIKTGWTAGGGVEGAFPLITGWNTTNWTWKVEYLYIDLGSISGSGFDGDFIGPYSWSAKFTDSIVRFGVNYRIP
jgi:outer membrane immunogenic protein